MNMYTLIKDYVPSMKVHELITLLQDLPEDHEVYVSSDEEGNTITRLAVADESWGFPERDGYRLDTVADEDVGTEYDKEDLVQAVVLWP